MCLRNLSQIYFNFVSLLERSNRCHSTAIWFYYLIIISQTWQRREVYLLTNILLTQPLKSQKKFTQPQI
jgi:hypothetical protein